MPNDPLFSMRKRNGKIEEITVGASAGVTLVRVVKLALVTGSVIGSRLVPWADIVALVKAVAS